jgi:quercetin dioxygenase-like cupin family protein
MTSQIFGMQPAGLVDRRDIETVEVLGPTIEYVSDVEQDDHARCVLRGTIPPGVIVPLHTHADPETFVQLSGDIDAYDGSRWIHVRSGDVFHVPGNARHAFRNSFGEPSVSVIVTTARIARFFREVGRALVSGKTQSASPSPDVIQHFLEVSERYGYWNASPDENAKIGLTLPSAA